jgi:hypothetical protein
MYLRLEPRGCKVVASRSNSLSVISVTDALHDTVGFKMVKTSVVSIIKEWISAEAKLKLEKMAQDKVLNVAIKMIKK